MEDIGLSFLNVEGDITTGLDEFDMSPFENDLDLNLNQAEPVVYSSATPSMVTLSSLNSSAEAENKTFFNLDYFEGSSRDPSIDVTFDCETNLKSDIRSPSPMSMTASLSGSEHAYCLSSPNHSEIDETDFVESIMLDTVTGIQVKEECDPEVGTQSNPRRSYAHRPSSNTSSTGKSSSLRGVNQQSGPWCKTKNRNNSKNAVAARENRQRKKQYIQSLEEMNSQLQEKNLRLKKESAVMKKKVCSLEEEVQYLRKVLYNQSALAGLLKKMNQSDVRLSTPISNPDDIPEGGTSTSSSTGGVCLHVNGNDTVLKFCANCAREDKP